MKCLVSVVHWGFCFVELFFCCVVFCCQRNCFSYVLQYCFHVFVFHFGGLIPNNLFFISSILLMSRPCLLISTRSLLYLSLPTVFTSMMSAGLMSRRDLVVASAYPGSFFSGLLTFDSRNSVPSVKMPESPSFHSRTNFFTMRYNTSDMI